jgi:hypothetical protein
MLHKIDYKRPLAKILGGFGSDLGLALWQRVFQLEEGM